MAFSDLTAQIDIMRGENTDFFVDLSDSDLTALKRVTAIGVLENDIITQMGLRDTDADILDELATTYSQRLNYALTLKQLETYYIQNMNVGGTLSEMRKDDYERRYNVERKAFRDFKTVETITYLVNNGRMQIG